MKNARQAAATPAATQPGMRLGENPADAQKPAVSPLFTDYAIEQFADFLLQFPDPDHVLEAAGLDRTDLRRLESDDEIIAALETRESAVKSTPWRIEPGDGGDYSFIYPLVAAHIETIIEGAWRAVPYGYAVQEVTYRKDGRQIVWDHISARPFEWFAPRAWGKREEDRQAIAAVEAMGLVKPACALSYFPAYGSAHNARTGENVHLTRPGKFFCTRRRPEDSRNPAGEALLSRLYWPWFFRTNGWKFWAKFLERFGSPMLIGKTANNTADMATALARALQSAVAAVGKNDDVEAISPNNAGDAFERYSSAVDRRIQKVVLGQTLTTDSNGKGSYALGQVHNLVRDDRRIADVRMITGTIQSMIDTVMVLNGRRVGAVKFIMEDETGLQADRAERDAKLATAKIVKFTPEYLLRAYDFEAGDFEIPEDAAPPPAGGTPPGKPTGTPATKASLQFAAGGAAQTFTPAQQAIEDLADAALEEARSPIPVDAIKAAIEAATSPEDLAERLSEVYLGNSPDEFRGILERALFAADVMGYAHADSQADIGAKPKPEPKTTETPGPVFHLSAAIHLPESAVAAAAGAQAPVTIENHIHVPEQAAPQITVEPAAVTVENSISVQPADLKQSITVQPAEIREVAITSMPTRETTTTVKRDDDENIDKVSQIERDKE
jgi:phage gp29-like protein